MILSPLLFIPSLYSHSNLKNFFVPSHFSTDLITISDAAGATIAMLQAAKKDYIVYIPVAKHAVSYMNGIYVWELTNTVYTKLEETKSRKCVDSP